MFRLLIAVTLASAVTLGAKASRKYNKYLRVNCQIGRWNADSADWLKCNWEGQGYQNLSDYCLQKEDSFWQTKGGLRKGFCGLTSQMQSELEIAASRSSAAEVEWVYPEKFNEISYQEKVIQISEPSATNSACFLKVNGSNGVLYCHKKETRKNGKCVNVVNKNQCGRGTARKLSNFRKNLGESECKMKKACRLNGSKSCVYDDNGRLDTRGRVRAVANNGEKPKCTYKSIYDYSQYGNTFRYAPGALCKNGVWVHEETNEPITDSLDLCRDYWESDGPEAVEQSDSLSEQYAV